MSRGLSNDIKQVLGSDRFITAELIEVELDTPLYLTTASFDISAQTETSGGTQTYYAQGRFLGYTQVNETSEVRIASINVTFSGASSTFTDIALNSNYLHRAFRIYKVFLLDTDMSLIDDPVMVYSGSLTGATVKENILESSVTFETSNEFYDFDRVAGRRTNDGSQQSFFPGDRGMEFSTAAIADIQWGKA